MDYYTREQAILSRIESTKKSLQGGGTTYQEVIGGDVYDRHEEMSSSRRRELQGRLSSLESELEELRASKRRAEEFEAERRRRAPEVMQKLRDKEAREREEKEKRKEENEKYVKDTVKTLKKQYKRRYGLLFRTARRIQGNAPQFKRLGQLSRGELEYLEDKYIGNMGYARTHFRTKKQKEEAKRYIERVAEACRKSSYDIKKEREESARKRGYYR